MKRKNLKHISLALASAAVFAGLGGITLKNNVTANAAVQEKHLTELFAVSNAVIKSKDIQETVDNETKDVKVTAFEIRDDGSAWIKRDLALKWYEASETDSKKGTAKYFTTSFALTSLDFISFSVSMATPSAWATEDGMSTNVIKFTKENDKFYVEINEAKTEITLEANKLITITLSDGESDGEMNVSIDGTVRGQFVNVGANYANYEYNKHDSLKFSFDLEEETEVEPTDAEEKKATLLLYDINNQSFRDLTAEEKVKDTAAPVLVLNEELYGFALGTQFSLDYLTLDVFQDSSISKEIKAYQYNPNYTAPTDDTDTDNPFEKLETLSTTSYFDKTVYNNGTKDTTVYAEELAEFIAIQITVWDSTFNGTSGNEKAVYDLSWYTTESRVIDYTETTEKGTNLSDTLNYIFIDQSDKNPSYNTNYVWNEGTETKGMSRAKFVDTKEYKGFQDALKAALKTVYAGTSTESYVNIPSLKWLFNLEDTYGYRNMRFTISYRKPGATSPSTASSLSYNGLKFTADKEGKYEFKVFASDKEGNPMQYYLDGELVDVTSENVWDIEAIPYFEFELEDKGLKVKDSTTNTSRKDTKALNQTYTMKTLTVLGASNLKQAFALYKVDFTEYNKTASTRIKEEHLIGITYEDIAKKLPTDLANKEDIFDVYLNAYAAVLANRLLGDNASAEALEALTKELKEEIFVRISDAGDRINGKEADDKYEWNSSSKSFKTVEEGYFIVLADYWEEFKPEQRATAYQLVLVQSKIATISGESQWWKDNLASVILFSISGVLLIAVIVLLFIKPSEEKLEDLDGAVATKKERKRRK